MRYYIIEHPTRGVLVDLEFDYDGPKPKFSYTAGRSDERTEKYNHVSQARKRLEQLPDKIRVQCRILKSPDRPFSNAAFSAMTTQQRKATFEWMPIDP